MKTAREARANNRKFTAGDFAFARVDDSTVMVRMEFHALVDGTTFTGASLLTPAPSAHDTEWCRTYKLTGGETLLKTECLIASVTYIESGGCIAALVPAVVRVGRGR